LLWNGKVDRDRVDEWRKQRENRDWMKSDHHQGLRNGWLVGLEWHYWKVGEECG
jgi:hypothetical protein